MTKLEFCRWHYPNPTWTYMESSNQQPAVPSSFSGTSHSHPFTAPHQHVAQPQCKCLKDPDQLSQKHLSPLPSSPSSTHYIGYLL
ncbi:hypothetical protein CROQUDRAFT_93118 [Cronartium quercuum f. sp. fusiforme G11]|uniref:Uncharacterized protein n=1 Tax=Cronartium quercuum f. sp. fusiforme G11 TaxID=708437 RepID=A0A9P6NKY6_9BASI|nr:hypothetical protein CROQUDRAFT_93118 [Cronartium quercuum f. sp. fusiforme G11]